MVNINTPSYISVAKLDRTLELVSARNFSEIGASYFIDREYGRADAFLAINTLKFLKIIDENGHPTANAEAIRLQGEARKKEFKRIVKEAYKPIFDSIPNPQELSPEELSNEFTAHYKLSRRVVRSALPVFNRLLIYAGMREEDKVAKRAPKEPKAKKDKGQEKAPEISPREKAGLDLDFHIPIVEGKMYIEIPDSIHKKTYTDDALNDDLRALVKKALEFANKHIPAEEPEKDS